MFKKSQFWVQFKSAFAKVLWTGYFDQTKHLRFVEIFCVYF